MNITGKDLRNMRLNAGLGVLKIATKVGVCKKTFQNWENDIGAPKINQFIDSCEACNICTASFLIANDAGKDSLKCVEIAYDKRISK